MSGIMSETSPPDNVLLSLYEQYLGEPETETEVYSGFGLFFGGVAFAVLGLLLFTIGAGVYGLREPGYFSLAQPGYLFGLLSVPLALMGVVVLLPTSRRIVTAAFVGLAFAVVAAGAFLWAYPTMWFEFGPWNTLFVVGTYAVGLAIIIATTGSALVAHRLAQGGEANAGTTTADSDGDGTSTESISDAEIESDIDAAMSDVEISWGGVEKTETRRLNFSTDYADEASGSLDVEAEQTVSTGGVDAEVEGLKQLKGGEKDVETADGTVDDETAALRELKDRKRSGDLSDDSDEDGPWSRLRSLF
jgi:hypothetical protein